MTPKITVPLGGTATPQFEPNRTAVRTTRTKTQIIGNYLIISTVPRGTTQPQKSISKVLCLGPYRTTSFPIGNAAVRYVAFSSIEA